MLFTNELIRCVHGTTEILHYFIFKGTHVANINFPHVSYNTSVTH